MRATLATAKEEGIPGAVGLCASDTRFRNLLNQAQRRLLAKGTWWGCYQKVRFCLTDGNITWPRQVAAIHAVTLCNEPLVNVNEWFEFLPTGPGPLCTDDCLLMHKDNGTAVTFGEITGTDSKIKVYADVTEAASAKITVQGYDENGQWIRTQVGGVWIDGEQILISTTPQTSTKFFTSVTGVSKPVTNGLVRVYAADQSSAVETALGYYEPDETLPVYRRSTITGFDGVSPCCTGADCETLSVEAMVKLDFIPARNDEDWLIVSNLAALRSECISLDLRDKARATGDFTTAEAFEQDAIRVLQEELNHYLGPGHTVPVNFANAGVFGAGTVAYVQ